MRHSISTKTLTTMVQAVQAETTTDAAAKPQKDRQMKDNEGRT